VSFNLVLEHIMDLAVVLRKAAREQRPGGAVPRLVSSMLGARAQVQTQVSERVLEEKA
jgi:hypothetical protein